MPRHKNEEQVVEIEKYDLLTEPVEMLPEPIQKVQMVEEVAVQPADSRLDLLTSFITWLNSEQVFLAEIKREPGMASVQKLTLCHRDSRELVSAFLSQA